MLTVITPATSSRLTTVTRAKASGAFGATADGTMSVLLDQASQTVVDYCRRSFALQGLRETVSRCDLAGGVLLSCFPVVAVTSVVLDGTTLAVDTDYEFDADGLRRVWGSGHRGAWWGDRLTVEYTAGYVLPSDSTGGPAPTLPASVERAAILLAGAFLSNGA